MAKLYILAIVVYAIFVAAAMTTIIHFVIKFW
jgi:hypothetical protein